MKKFLDFKHNTKQFGTIVLTVTKQNFHLTASMSINSVRNTKFLQIAVQIYNYTNMSKKAALLGGIYEQYFSIAIPKIPQTYRSF